MDKKTVEKNRLLIPVWDGNRDEPPTKQIRVLFKHFPGPCDVLNLKKEYRNRHGDNIVEYDDVTLLMLYVEKIENLTLNGEKIEKPFDLIASGWPGFMPLVEEIRKYALTPAEELTEGEGEASE